MRTQSFWIAIIFRVALVLGSFFALYGLQTEIEVASSDASFEEEFISVYGFESSDYWGLGDEGFVGRWATDNELEKQQCSNFEYCQFIVLATVESCFGSIVLEFEIYDESDVFIAAREAISGPLNRGSFALVELGNEETDEVFFIPTVVRCSQDPLQI